MTVERDDIITQSGLELDAEEAVRYLIGEPTEMRWLAGGRHLAAVKFVDTHGVRVEGSLWDATWKVVLGIVTYNERYPDGQIFVNDDVIRMDVRRKDEVAANLAADVISKWLVERSVTDDRPNPGDRQAVDLIRGLVERDPSGISTLGDPWED